MIGYDAEETGVEWSGVEWRDGMESRPVRVR
jgi:hypothetical protein